MGTEAFPTILRRLRLQKRLSQEDLALKANLHRTYVSQLERGLKSPSLKTLERLAHVLNICLSDFIKLIEEE